VKTLFRLGRFRGTSRARLPRFSPNPLQWCAHRRLFPLLAAPRQGARREGERFAEMTRSPPIAEQPDATLVELRDRLNITVTPWAICKALRELKLSYKKSRSTRRNRTARTSPMPAPSGG